LPAKVSTVRFLETPFQPADSPQVRRLRNLLVGVDATEQLRPDHLDLAVADAKLEARRYTVRGTRQIAASHTAEGPERGNVFTLRSEIGYLWQPVESILSHGSAP